MSRQALSACSSYWFLLASSLLTRAGAASAASSAAPQLDQQLTAFAAVDITAISYATVHSVAMRPAHVRLCDVMPSKKLHDLHSRSAL